MKNIIETLAPTYQQLYLNPDKDDQETYRRVVLKGEEPLTKSLSHYRGDAFDRIDTMHTPAGDVQVVTLGNRQDFELVIRGLMAAKEGPLTPVPESQGAATLTLFNWPRIRKHLSAFPMFEQAAEFKRFLQVKENYIDMLIVLSRGPYSNVSASAAGHSPEAWMEISDTIRRYHELTHVICRRLYPDKIDAVKDELVADAVGLYAAYGSFDPEMEKLFLGIKNDRYTGGRLENYTDQPDQLAASVCAALDEMKQRIDAHPGAEPFDLIAILV